MRLLTIALIVGVCALTACAGSQTKNIVVAKEYHQAVSLEEFVVPQALKLSHPCSIDTLTLKEAMTSVNYLVTSVLSKTQTQLSVFQKDEVERLAPVLVEALSLAQDGQYVRFVSFNQGKGLFLNTSQKTEGVVFVSTGRHLHLAFNYINSKRSGSESTAMYHEFSKLNPLKVTTSKTPLVATDSGLKIHTFADGSPAPAWIIADLAVIEKKRADRVALVSIQPKMQMTQTQAQTNQSNNTATLTSTTTRRVVQSVDKTNIVMIKTKLKFLKNLFEEGLISQEEYQAKKQNILDKI